MNDINFPVEELKHEDYGPVQLFGFKEYYKIYLSELIYKVRFIIINQIFIFILDLSRKKKKYIC